MFLLVCVRICVVTFRVENYRENESAAKVIYRLSWRAGITESPLPQLPLPPPLSQAFIRMYVCMYIICNMCVCMCICVNGRGMVKNPIVIAVLYDVYTYINTWSRSAPHGLSLHHHHHHQQLYQPRPARSSSKAK